MPELEAGAIVPGPLDSARDGNNNFRLTGSGYFSGRVVASSRVK